MNFHVDFGRENEVWPIRAAGIEVRPYQMLCSACFAGRKPALPAAVDCLYHLSDPPTKVHITILARRHLQFEVEDSTLAKGIEENIHRFRQRLLDPASLRAWQASFDSRFQGIFQSEGIKVADLEGRKVPLHRRIQRPLMELCEDVYFLHRERIYEFIEQCIVPQQDRDYLVRWLLRRFALEGDLYIRNRASDALLMHCKGMANELLLTVVALVRDPSFGASRLGLIDVLVKLKYPDCANVIVSVMHQGNLAWSALEHLGKLNASQHEAHIRQYLRHPDADVRIQAKQALKKMNCTVEASPPPVHLVNQRKLLPEGLDEWSSSTDFDSLSNELAALGQCIDQRFGSKEIAEVIGVAEDTKLDQTKVFRFPIALAGEPSEVWLSIFMDDIGSPELSVFGDPELIRRLRTRTTSDD